MANYNQNVIFNGIADFRFFDGQFSWDDRWIAKLGVYLEETDQANVSASFRKTWEIDYFRVRGSGESTSLALTDQQSGDRDITLMRLQDGNFDVDLSTTRVDFFRGNGEDSKFTLDFGEWLRALMIDDGKSANITLQDGARMVRSNVRTTLVADGFVDSVSLGNGNHDLTFLDGLNSVHFGLGKTSVVIGADTYAGAITGFGESGSAHTIEVKAGAGVRSVGVSNGADKLLVRKNANVEQAVLGEGNDTVVVAKNGSIGQLSLGSGNDKLTVSGWVGVVEDYGGRTTVEIKEGGGVGAVRMNGNGADTVTTSDGWIDVIFSGDGKDTVTVGSGGAGEVGLGRGTDKVTTTTGYVNVIEADGGTNTILVGTGGAGFIKAFGQNTITAKGYLETVFIFDGDDVVNIRGGAGFVRTGEGADIVRIQNGSYVAAIQTGDGADTVRLQDGSSMSISLGNGKDTIVINKLGDGGFAQISGGNGFDTADFSNFDVALYVDRGEGKYQNVAAPLGDDTVPGEGKFLIHPSIEAVIGGSAGDTFISGRNNDTFTGKGGADSFVFNPDGGNDKITDFEVGIDTAQFVGATALGQLGFAQFGDDVEVSYDGTTVLFMDRLLADIQDAGNFEF